MSINNLGSYAGSRGAGRLFSGVAVWVVLGTVFAQYTAIVSDPWDTVFIVLVYGLLYLAYWSRYGFDMSIPRSVGIAFAGIVVLFLLQVALGKYARPSLGLFPIYTTGVAFANLFLVPRLVDRRTVFQQIALFGAVLGVLFLGAVITGYDTTIPLLADDGFGVINRFVSNVVGIVAVVGAISSLDEVVMRRSFSWILPLIGNLIFAVIITSPGVVLILAVGTAVYVLDSVMTRRFVSGIVGCGFVFSILLVSVALALPLSLIKEIPTAVETVPGLTAHMRYVAWRGAFGAIRDSHLVWGAGFQTAEFFSQYTLDGRAVGAHNSFLLVFSRAGIAAFALYLVLIGGPIARALREHTVDRLLLALIVALGVNIFFESYSFWSTGIHGVLLGVVFGYLIDDLTEPDETLAAGTEPTDIETEREM